MAVTPGPELFLVPGVMTDPCRPLRLAREATGSAPNRAGCSGPQIRGVHVGERLSHRRVGCDHLGGELVAGDTELLEVVGVGLEVRGFLNPLLSGAVLDGHPRETGKDEASGMVASDLEEVACTVVS